ncbi:MAG: protein adenylyltransferase SelO [Steroidobacteraceae bacterium]
MTDPTPRLRESPSVTLLQSSFAQLPDSVFERVNPTPVARPVLIRVNEALAAELQLPLAGQDSETLASLFAGNVLAAGSVPIAMGYAGHQFGGFVPQLGDGRAILLGEAQARDGTRYDIQLKGSGRTRFSRRGDGRAALGPVLREYLVSEAMHALGIPTTRALAAVTTGETVLREVPLPGAIVTRVAKSHVRVGTFEFAATLPDGKPLRALTDHVIERLYPSASAEASPALSLLRAVVERQASLVAQWMHVGFIHGVMNTDNMALSGETIDFGPCAFVDAYDPATVFSAIDSQGRYAFANQPPIAQWNLARLAEALLPLLDPDPERAVSLAEDMLSHFATCFRARWVEGLRAKLGLTRAEEGDLALAEGFLALLHQQHVDFTLAFRRLCDAADEPVANSVRELFLDPGVFDAWSVGWRRRLGVEAVPARERAQAMRRVNPLYIPRNHLVEQVIAAGVEQGNFAPFGELLDVLSRPFEEQRGRERFALPPQPDQVVFRTYCGT